MLTIKFTKRFKKDIKICQKRSLDLSLLKNVIKTLSNGETLAEKYRDHALSGIYAGFRECHIKPDWILIYSIDNGQLILTLSRTGSHSDILKM